MRRKARKDRHRGAIRAPSVRRTSAITAVERRAYLRHTVDVVKARAEIVEDRRARISTIRAPKFVTSAIVDVEVDVAAKRFHLSRV